VAIILLVAEAELDNVVIDFLFNFLWGSGSASPKKHGLMTAETEMGKLL
jgi:hypothetical protein